MSRFNKRIAPQTTQITLTSNKDGFFDFMVEITNEFGELKEDFRAYFEEAEFIKVGDFENGELYSYCWGPQIWAPGCDDVQGKILALVKEYHGCVCLEIERPNGDVETVGFLADYPEFHQGHLRYAA